MHEKWLTNSRDAKKREQSRARRHAVHLPISHIAHGLRFK
jgi:hypothetical protein